MKRLILAFLTSVVALSGCMSMSQVPPEQRRDDRWRETSEILSRPPTETY